VVVPESSVMVFPCAHKRLRYFGLVLGTLLVTAGCRCSETSHSREAPVAIVDGAVEQAALKFSPERLELIYSDPARRTQTLWFSGQLATLLELKAATLEGHPTASEQIAVRRLKEPDPSTGALRHGVELTLRSQPPPGGGEAKLVIATGLTDPLRVVVDVSFRN